MPRRARTRSRTDIYHIMTRGINKEQIFKNDIYKKTILDIIKELSADIKFDMIAYCIMNNHLHLLLKIGDDDLEILMKRINIKYAMYYNKARERYGHVFQDRFKSEEVESEKYLFGALRYIHNNPIKAKMVNSILDYKWSSAKDYYEKKSTFVSKKYIEEITKRIGTQNDYIQFHNIKDKNVYVDIKEEENEKVKDIIDTITTEFALENKIKDKNKLEISEKETLAKEILKANIIPIKEIAKICNLTYYKIGTIKKEIANE